MTVELTGGGAIFEGIGDETKVCIVHRGLYNDWTLPKGHIERGESIEECALREVREETGFECRIIDPSPYISERQLSSGATKVTHYFAMTVVKGEFAPNDECDAIEWGSIEVASKKLTFDNDKKVLSVLFDTYRNNAGGFGD